MDEKKNEMRVGIEVELPDKPKRSRQDELIQVIKFLAVAVVALAVLAIFAVGGSALVGLVLRLVL
jgi:hypothetical protein